MQKASCHPVTIYRPHSHSDFPFVPPLFHLFIYLVSFSSSIIYVRHCIRTCTFFFFMAETIEGGTLTAEQKKAGRLERKIKETKKGRARRARRTDRGNTLGLQVEF